LKQGSDDFCQQYKDADYQITLADFIFSNCTRVTNEQANFNVYILDMELEDKKKLTRFDIHDYTLEFIVPER
jgi:hypothetical protein